MSIVLQAVLSLPGAEEWPIRLEDLQEICEFVKMDWDAEGLGAELLSLGLIEPTPSWKWTDEGLALKERLRKIDPTCD